MNYPHTMEILKPYADYSHIPEDALIRGQLRHRAYAATLMGVWGPPVAQEDQGQFDSFRRWVDKYIIKVWFVEQTLIDAENGYVGTIDFGGELSIKTENPGVVLDWKPPFAGGQITWAQVASYINLAKVNRYPVDRGGFLRMDPNGGIARMTWVNAGTKDFCGFLAALNCHRYFKS